MSRLEDALNYKAKNLLDNGVLKNKLGITDKDELDKAERAITTYKLAKLYINPGKQDFDVDHYLSIHKYLFGDIYPFAGEIRSENIKKQIPFCIPYLIYDNLVDTLNKAKKMAVTINSREELIDFIAYLYSELDIIHPFREGNGRTEREFLRQYVKYICKTNKLERYTLDYSLVTNKEAFIQSIIIADARCDYDALKLFINDILVKDEKKKVKVKKY